VLAISAMLTAYYMTRLYLLVFFGESRLSQKEKAHLHESPWIMTLPLGILGIASLAGGWFGAPVALEHGHETGALNVSEGVIMGVSVLIALAGAFVAHRKYSGTIQGESPRDPFKVDAFYLSFFGKGTRRVSAFFGRVIEDGFFGRMMQFSGAAVDLGGNLLRTLQTGSAQGYLLMMVLAVAALMCWVFLGVH